MTKGKRERAGIYASITSAWETCTQIHNRYAIGSRANVGNVLRALASEGLIDKRVEPIDKRPDLLVAYYRKRP